MPWADEWVYRVEREMIEEGVINEFAAVFARPSHNTRRHINEAFFEKAYFIEVKFQENSYEALAAEVFDPVGELREDNVAAYEESGIEKEFGNYRIPRKELAQGVVKELLEPLEKQQ